MPSTIYEDAIARPDLFHWFGINESDFDRWLAALPLRAHPGLVTFWRRTGGGDLFESETILGPLVPNETENVLKVNELHWQKGLARDTLIFHSGTYLSASQVNRRTHRRIMLLNSDTYKMEGRFDTFDAWYPGAIRSEYADRYGLPPDEKP